MAAGQVIPGRPPPAQRVYYSWMDHRCVQAPGAERERGADLSAKKVCAQWLAAATDKTVIQVPRALIASVLAAALDFGVLVLLVERLSWSAQPAARSESSPFREPSWTRNDDSDPAPYQ